MMAGEMHWLATAFTIANTVRAACYLPQILAVARSTNGARDIALLTWTMWAINNLLGAAYAALVAQVPALALSFLASALACMVTITITLAKRAAFRRAGSAPRRQGGVVDGSADAEQARAIAATAPDPTRPPGAVASMTIRHRRGVRRRLVPVQRVHGG